MQAPVGQPRRDGVIALRHAGNMQAVAQVLQRGKVGTQPIGVAQVRHARKVGRWVARHVTAPCMQDASHGLQQTGQHAQHAGLAAAIGAMQVQQLAGVQVEVQGAQALPRHTATRATQAAGGQQGRRCVSGSHWLAPPWRFPWVRWRPASRWTSAPAEYAARCARYPCGNRYRSWTCPPDRSNACSARARSGA
ncbi:hypothetical protein D3C72_1665450 [compost metagenome]